MLRLLLGRPLPLNEGLLEPVEIMIPEGILNPPFPERPEEAPAVVGGNVETSQRLVDTLIKALGLLACGQGTMNNLIFGNPRFGYYETICGGAGAGASFDGESAIHTHMTNIRSQIPRSSRCATRCASNASRYAVARGERERTGVVTVRCAR